MANAAELEPFGENSIDLRELGITFLRGWKIIGLCVVAALLIAVYYLHTATYVYRSQMQVTPVQSGGEGAAPSRLGALGGLASLAGLTLPSDPGGIQFRLYVESLHSRDLAEDLAKNPDLMKAVFASEWDGIAGVWREPPPHLLERIKRPIRVLLGYPADPWMPPDAARLQQYLELYVQIQEDAKKPFLVKVVFDSADPQFGVPFLNALNSADDDHLRQKALTRARQYVDYLTAKLGTVTIGEHREAIVQALSEQEKFAMIASSSAPFAADLFDKPSSLSTPIEPQARNVLITAVLIGFAAGAGIVFLLSRIGGGPGQLRRLFRPRPGRTA